MARGKLIVFEGLDRSGKSTQCATLVERLRNQGQRVRFMRFPDRTTPIGQMIDAYLRGQSSQDDHAIHLLFAANRWEAAAGIRSAIEDAGETVVVDRYAYSGCVYSAAKRLPSLPLGWAWQAEVGLPKPDLCVFLDIAEEAAAARGGFGEEKYETGEMQGRVRELYAELRVRLPGQFAVVDGGREREVVADDVLRVVEEACKKVDEEGGGLGVLEGW